MMPAVHYLPSDRKHLWPIVSQHKGIATPADTESAEKVYLPELVNAWQIIEKTTGYRWKSTSYWRKSPSHHRGIALDIAPDIAAGSINYYAVTNGSDPVLYKREKLLRDLQHVCAIFHTLDPNLSIGIFVEPDHLHLQVFERAELQTPCRLYKWKIAKHSYADTLSRMEMPLIR